VDLTDYEKSGTWDVVDVPAVFISKYDEKTGQNISCAEYTIVMRRKTLFYTVNLILPCVLISMLSMVVFYLPNTAGEKITMCVSIFLALIVFLQVLVTNLLPPSSLSLPLFAKYLIFAVIIDVCCIVNSVISLNWSMRSPRTHVLSPAMRTFFFNYLAWFLMMRRPADTPPSQLQVAPDPAKATASALASASAVAMAPASRNELDLSDLHNVNCRYAKMSVRQRRRVLEASSQSSYDNLRQEYSKAIEAVRFTAAHLKNEDDFGEVRRILHYTLNTIMTETNRRGGVVCPSVMSVCLSVCRVLRPNSRMKRSRKPEKIGRMVKRSKVKVTSPINTVNESVISSERKGI